MENIIAVSLTFEGQTRVQEFNSPVDMQTAKAYYRILHSEFEQDIIEDELDSQADSWTERKRPVSADQRMKKEWRRRHILDDTAPVYKTI
jgi:hypothetical protein